MAPTVSGPRVVIDGHGTSYAVWIVGPATRGVARLKTRLREPGHSWGSTTTTTLDEDARLAAVKVAPDGTMVVLWTYLIDADCHECDDWARQLPAMWPRSRASW